MIVRLKKWMLSRQFVSEAAHKEASDLYIQYVDTYANVADKELCRQILKVKDFSQVKRQLSPDERKQYAAAASLVYNSQPFKDIVTEIQYDQLVFMGLQSENDRQLMIGRGTINGADLIEQRMRELDAEHQQNVKDNQPADGSPYEPINKLETN
jgi:hypothetical protein